MYKTLEARERPTKLCSHGQITEFTELGGSTPTPQAQSSHTRPGLTSCEGLCTEAQS